MALIGWLDALTAIEATRSTRRTRTGVQITGRVDAGLAVEKGTRMPTRLLKPPKGPTFSPLDFHLFTGLQVPDPITFALGERWLNRPQLYPRQATLLKVIFLREDLFTEYDYAVVQGWEESFRKTGNNGIVPDVLKRMRLLKSLGYFYFREVLLVLGRRAGKGYVSAIAMAYVMWRYMSKGDPQKHYGIDRDKQMACFIYAGKKEQARENLWKDLVNVIQGSTCFAPYMSKPLGESLSVYAPHDFVRMKKLRDRGIITERDMATFVIQPKEATLMSGRGPTSFMQGYDEMAHVVNSGANRSAEEVYGAATPALDQFKKDAFIVEPSSPWQMIGQFYTNWQHAIAIGEDGEPEYPELLMLQLASWEIYYDWEVAHQLPLFPEDFLGDLDEYVKEPHPQLQELQFAIQEYDDGMRKLEKSNPDTFKVERRSHWQATQDAYLDPDKITAMFRTDLEMRTEGILSVFYKGHADPASVNAHFGVAIAHMEDREDGFKRCVFDYIHHWSASDFPDNIIHYPTIGDHLFRLITGFKTDEFTFDQWNSIETIQRLMARVREEKIPKRIDIYEKTATNAHNWERAENFKVCLNQGWIEAPYYEQAELELRFLQLKNGKVEKQDAGPVQTKDVADCLMEVVWTILGEQAHQWTKGALSNFKAGGTAPGGFDPYAREKKDENILGALSGLGRAQGALARGGGFSPARNPTANRRRR
jgi:hypothetical protein